MSQQAVNTEPGSVDSLYEEAGYWHVNTGGETIHAKRMPGRFRTLKWLTASVWLIYFFGPYLRWGDRQAVLFDIPNRQFHIFDITIMPQDVWMLSLVLLFFAILLAVVTSIAGRVFCGYFCFQTVWTDVFTWIEEKLEGQPARRRKLAQAPLDFYKLRVKTTKHALWILIGALTGLSFAAWFTDAYQLWKDLFNLQASTVAYVVLGMFTAGTYVLAGFMREQVCFWLCPYARIQGVMYDTETILPTYDFKRGEPRGKLKKGETTEGRGDCVDCNQCVAVCPTGIDIRQGQQEGCITCAFCIDACDAVMDKVARPRGLIRYASLDEIEGKPTLPLFKRARVLVYIGILVAAASGILYGLTHLGALEINVIHERLPLFVRQSDGSIQNKYYVKILNKSDKDQQVTLTVHGPKGTQVVGAQGPLLAKAADVTAYTVFLRVPKRSLEGEVTPVEFVAQNTTDESITASYDSMFMGPR